MALTIQEGRPAAVSARSGPTGGGRSERANALDPGYSISLDWPEFVISESGTDRTWRIDAVEAHLLSVVDGKRSYKELIGETVARIRLRVRNQPAVSERDVKTALLRLSMGDILTDRNGLIAVKPKYATITIGSLGGAIATLLCRSADFPLRAADES